MNRLRCQLAGVLSGARLIGRIMALLLGLLIIMAVAPSLQTSCGVTASCTGWLNSRLFYLLAYLLLVAIPVVLIFIGHGARYWLGIIGWIILVVMAGFYCFNMEKFNGVGWALSCQVCLIVKYG